MQEINLSTQRLPLIYPREKRKKKRKKKEKKREEELTAQGNLIDATSISEDVSVSINALNKKKLEHT